MNDELKSEIGEWIVRATLAGTSDVEILAGVCERLNGAGLSLVRARIGADLLDPTLDRAGCAVEPRPRGLPRQPLHAPMTRVDSDDWLLSPFKRLLESGERTLRRRLDRPISAASSRCSIGSTTGASRTTWRSGAGRRKACISAISTGFPRRGRPMPAGGFPTTKSKCSARSCRRSRWPRCAHHDRTRAR